MKACRIGGLLGDPENPPCARLVLSGLLQVQGDLAGALALSSDTLRLREQGRLELNEQQVAMLHTFQSELRKQMETAGQQ